jgi:hypothetical protein
MSHQGILSLSPCSRQVGYAYFENGQLVDWGIRNNHSGPILERMFKKGLAIVGVLTVRFRPSAVILPAMEIRTRRANRQRFIRATHAILSSTQQSVAFCSDRQMKNRFKELLGKRPTIQRIAVFLAGVFPELKPVIPKPRRPWESQDYWTPMFDAVARGYVWIYTLRDE